MAKRKQDQRLKGMTDGGPEPKEAKEMWDLRGLTQDLASTSLPEEGKDHPEQDSSEKKRLHQGFRAWRDWKRSVGGYVRVEGEGHKVRFLTPSPLPLILHGLAVVSTDPSGGTTGAVVHSTAVDPDDPYSAIIEQWLMFDAAGTDVTLTFEGTNGPYQKKVTTEICANRMPWPRTPHASAVEDTYWSVAAFGDKISSDQFFAGLKTFQEVYPNLAFRYVIALVQRSVQSAVPDRTEEVPPGGAGRGWEEVCEKASTDLGLMRAWLYGEWPDDLTGPTDPTDQRYKPQQIHMAWRAAALPPGNAAKTRALLPASRLNYAGWQDAIYNRLEVGALGEFVYATGAARLYAASAFRNLPARPQV